MIFTTVSQWSQWGRRSIPVRINHSTSMSNRHLFNTSGKGGKRLPELSNSNTSCNDDTLSSRTFQSETSKTQQRKIIIIKRNWESWFWALFQQHLTQDKGKNFLSKQHAKPNDFSQHNVRLKTNTKEECWIKELMMATHSSLYFTHEMKNSPRA